MGVSKNRGTPIWMVYNGKPFFKWMIWGYHYFRKHPYHIIHVTAKPSPKTTQAFPSPKKLPRLPGRLDIYPPEV